MKKKYLLAVCAVIIIAGVVYGLHRNSPLVYKNQDYGFSVILPTVWKEFTAEDATSNSDIPVSKSFILKATKALEFCTRTTDPAWKGYDSGGRFCVFSVLAYPKSGWDQLKALEKQQPKDEVPLTEGLSVVGEKDNLIFVIEGRQEYPKDINPDLYLPKGDDFIKFVK